VARHGLLFIQAVTFADIPVMAAYLCLIALIFVVINLVVDCCILWWTRACAWARPGGTDAQPAMEGQRPGVCPHCAISPELTALRRDLHAHPELGFEEVYTGRRVKEALKLCGVDEIHEGIGRTGVVAMVRGRSQSASGSMVGLRADMDALPMTEHNDFSWKSASPGLMHGCGHDGHTAMLVGAARYLAETRNFDGTAVLIFQPGEEGFAGARVMMEDGLFDRFPVQSVYLPCTTGPP
jgi:metal-dependent amidase/aminoacylase/carboxypeptidase family protein